MKPYRIFVLLTAAPLLLVPFAGGCMFLQAPEPDPTPRPVPTPKPPFFDPAAGQPLGKPLNKANDLRLPDAFRIVSPITGDTVALQSFDTVTAGNPPKEVINLGPPDTVKLAGIVAPTADPGLQGAKNAITNWTAGQNLDVHADSKYPLDLDGKQVVQVFFKGRKGPYEGKQLSLNRMLVRSGWAVVDFYSPTAFDTSEWILDESYARLHKLGFWKYGQAIQQRVPVVTSFGTGAKSRVTIQVARPGDAPTPPKTTTNTTTTKTTVSKTTVTQTTAPAATVPPVPPTPAG